MRLSLLLAARSKPPRPRGPVLIEQGNCVSVSVSWQQSKEETEGEQSRCGLPASTGVALVGLPSLPFPSRGSEMEKDDDENGA